MWEDSQPDDRLTDSSQVQPLLETTFSKAQGQVKFVVFEPAWLPGDCQQAEVTLRPEQPPGRPAGIKAEDIGGTPWSEANPSSLRAVYRGQGRSMRIKQFLYDWAPPAASTAPLWRSPELKSFQCQDAIGWIGRDYLGHHGACVQLTRTQIELSVTQGDFDDQEIQTLFRWLAPADPILNQSVAEAPFHQLNYWVRYRLRGVQVPYGLWRYSQPRLYDTCRILSQEELRQGSPVPVLLPRGEDYAFDSAVVIRDPQMEHREVEWIYRRRENHSDHLWMIAMNAGSQLALPEKPQAEPHPAEVRRKISLRGRPVWYASLSEEHGAWEALWEESGTRYALWASTSQYLDAAGFKHLLEDLHPANLGEPPHPI